MTVKQEQSTECVGEPVASIYVTESGDREFDDWRVDLPVGSNILYTTPYVLCSCGTATGRQQRTAAEGEDTRRAWVGLNNDDWIRIYNYADKSAGRAAELAEEILKEKNCDTW